MNDPTDIKALEEYLKGGSEISQRYRELGGGEVPPELDRRVLEQARAASAQRKPNPSRAWLRWSAPVALAASVVLVLAVVMESGVQQDAMLATKPASAPEEREADAADMDRAQPLAANEAPRAGSAVAPEREQQVVMDRRSASDTRQGVDATVPAARADSDPRPGEPHRSAATTAVQTAKAVAPANPAAAEARRERVIEEVAVVSQSSAHNRQQSVAIAPIAAPMAPSVVSEPQQNTPTVAGSSAAPEKAAAADAAKRESAEVSEVIVTGNQVRRATPRIGPRGTISQRAFSRDGDEAAAAAQDTTDPEQWLNDIRDLRRDGEKAAADREWRRFRAAFPDYYVADDDPARSKP